MSYIIYFLFFILGAIIGSFGVIQILIVLRFSIPYTKKLASANILSESYPIIKSNMITVFVWTILIIFATLLVYIFGSAYSLYGFLFGLVFVTIMGFPRTGESETNVSEYISNYKHLLTKNIE